MHLIGINNSYYFGSLGTKDPLTGEFFNDAPNVWVGQLYKPAATPDAPPTETVGGPLPMTYQPASNGNYFGTIPAAITANLQDGKPYLLRKTFTIPPDPDPVEDLWEDCLAVYRSGVC